MGLLTSSRNLVTVLFQLPNLLPPPLLPVSALWPPSSPSLIELPLNHFPFVQVAALESPSVSDVAVNEAVGSYVALLLGLVAAGGGANEAAAPPAADAVAAAAETPDEALEAAEGGAARNGHSSGAPLAAPPSRLRHAVRWGWAEAVLAPPPGSQPRASGAADAAYELASVLLAAALRLAHAAAEASKDSASGVPTPASTRSYKLLREAAGLLELVAGQLAPALPAGLSADLDPQVGAGDGACGSRALLGPL